MKYLPLIITFFLFSCNADDKEEIAEIPANLDTTIEYKQLSGVNSNLLSLDVYYNQAVEIRKPVVVYVHGGGWSIGDKSNQLENKINLFRSLDYVFVSVNYRLSPFPFEINNANRIKYPDHNMDIADALLWVNNNIADYGGNKDQIALLGHSAGAHLVGLASTNKSFMENVGLSLANIKGVAVIDTEGYDINKQITSGVSQDMYINAFGMDSTLNRNASPIYNVNSSTIYPKFFIAKRGDLDRIGYANDFINVLTTNGVEVSQVDGSIYDHNGINNAIGEPNEMLITNSLKTFFSSCFD